MTNELFISENADLIAESSELISEHAFAPFMVVHCKIPVEQHDTLLQLDSKERVIATLKASRLVWTREKFQEFVKSCQTLLSMGVPCPSLAEVLQMRAPCCNPPTPK